MRICYIKKQRLDSTIANILKVIANKIEIKEIEKDKYIYNIPYIKSKKESNELKTSTINKVIKIIKTNNIDAICIQNDLEQYIKYFKNNNIFVLEGRWLFKILVNDILEYLSLKMETAFSTVTVLVNESTDINIETIKNLTKQVKTLKIVTNNINRFKFLEDKLYNEYGIAITISSNKKKALIKSNVIINIDFNQEELSEYNINRKAIIINLDNQIRQYNKSFAGISVNNYNIILNKKDIEFFKKHKIYEKFSKPILYESLIIKKDNLDNIIKKTKEDKIKIYHLMGNNGIINDKEYKEIKL